MSNVLTFPAKLSLQLDSGWIRDPETGRLGDHRYFWLEYVEPDGGVSSIWDGWSYVEALAAAERAWEPGMRFDDLHAREGIGGRQ
jgi:hypothetical protein